MRSFEEGTITRLVDEFIDFSDTGALRAREYSFDFAYNYFCEHEKPTRDMEQSCMQLGYYLASWGMLRGSSYIFNHTNARAYIPVIEIVERLNPTLRAIDADRWHESDVQQELLGAYAEIREAILPKKVSHLTLVTKIMLGVWGVVPAFDTYAINTFRTLAEPVEKSAFGAFSSRSLDLLGDFYRAHAAEIDELTQQVRTRDFITGQMTERHVTRAKIIDMAAFQYTRSPAGTSA